MTLNTAEIRHKILDGLELRLLTDKVNLPAFGFVEINKWLSSLEDRQLSTPNGVVKVTPAGVVFTHVNDSTKNRILFDMGLDGTTIFERTRAYETWMFFRFAPLNLIRFRELTDFANCLTRN